MPKPTPREVLKGIEDSEIDDEIERVSALTPEERDEELEAAGYDLAKVQAGADAMYERLQRAEADRRAKELEADARKRSLRPPKGRSRPVVFWFGAAAALIVVGAAVYALVSRPAPPAPLPPPPAPSAPPSAVPERPELIAASDLRRRAFDECNAKEWHACLADFDAASQLDPAGDQAPEVQSERGRATEALRGGPK